MPFKDPEKKKEYDREYNKRNRDRKRENNRRWENTEKGKATKQKWRKANRDKTRQSVENWRLRNKSRKATTEAKRRCAKLQRTPIWSDLVAITEVYENCPEGYHVDHVIPLQGKTVCGLHVLENLQYLPMIENCRKSNIFEGD